MGINNSVLDISQPCNVNELLSYINNNDIKSFKQGVKFINDSEDLIRVIMGTITEDRKEFFDILLDVLKVPIDPDPHYYFLEDSYKQCSDVIGNCSNIYYAKRLIEVHKHITPAEKGALLHLAASFGNKPISQQLILSGADINAVDWLNTTPLEEAIFGDNFELVSMLLYYGADVDDERHDVTAFMVSIRSESSEEIQRTLLEYQYDFNLTSSLGMSVLLLAIDFHSPLTLEIINRGANINYYDGMNNVISLAIKRHCDAEIFRLLWNEFDYEVWKTSCSVSVLLLFFWEDYDMPHSMCTEYLKILMENETKLQLDLEHHNKSSYFKSDTIISELISHCLRLGVDTETTESFILHLLSHGAYVFEEDIDSIFSYVLPLKDSTLLFDIILDMILYDIHLLFRDSKYHKYPLLTDFEVYMLYVAQFPYALLESTKKLRKLYVINNWLQMEILSILDRDTDYEESNYGELNYGESFYEETIYEKCRKALDTSVTFPSLLQLARDAIRGTICRKYDIKNSCTLQTIIRNLGLPKIIEDILLLNNCIYYIH